ncbi:MAG TPA: type II toxin-antitoxin system RelE/ParE family toxin [Casimicrobiaceae bacterium]|jgi:toxin ParE1/3/4
MRFEVLLTEDAVSDLEEIHEYLAEHDAPSKANYVLGRIAEAVENLASFPEGGPHPKELLALGIREYRQAFFKPYRLIYRVTRQRVYIYLIVDGRRDMQTLLARRLFAA